MIKSNFFRTARVLALATALAVQLAPTTSDASQISGMTIQAIGLSSNGTLAFVRFTTNITNGSPACSTTDNSLIFDHTTAKGKAAYSGLTAAYLAGKAVGGGGTGTCTTLVLDGGSITAENLSALIF